MAEPGALDYFYGTEAEQYTFYRIPKVLFTDPGFRRITADAKILYGLMLDRMGLSIRNNWLDEQERVFIYFTLEEAMDAMCCGHNKAVSLFTELDKVGLIERKKQGQGRPTKIYVKNFIRKEEVKTSENRKSALPESGTLDFRKSDTINTDKNKTDLSDTDPSIYPAVRPPEDRPPTAADTMDTIRAYREILKENIEYDHLRKNLGYDYELLDEILEILVDTVCSTRKMIRIGGEDFPKEVVKSRLLKLDSSHIEYVISSLRENTTKVRNIRAYLLTSLYNAPSITPRQTKFETNKEKLRQTIRKALATAASFDEFSSLLLREGVAVKESRGRLSYLTPDRTKPITARKLGDDFERAAVLAVLEQNAARAAEKAAALSIKDQLRADRAARTAPNVQRLVDIEQKKAEGKGRGYERWATMHNLKQMAATLNVYQEYGFTSPEQLEAAVDTAYQEMRQTSGELKALETKLQGKKELQQQVLAYAKTKPARDGLKAQKSEKARAAYRQANESDFIIAEAAARYFKAHGITKLPARKALQAEIEQLVSKKSGLYNTYHEQKQRYVELQTVKRNIDQILRREEPRRRKEQSHER